MADDEDGEAPMSAECSVEALPALAGADISVHGLRLRLDIRIVPRREGETGSAGDGAMFRVVTAKLSKASPIPAYQWAAAMLGVGTLLIALTVWIAGNGAEPSPLERGAAGTSAASAAPAAPLETKPAVPAAPIPAASELTAPNVPVAEAPVPAAPAAEPTPAAPGPRVQPVGAEAARPSKRPEPPKRPVPKAERRVVAAASPQPDPPPPQPTAQRPAARADMLDLFGDTK